MAMVSSTLVAALTNLWTEPPESRSFTETADAIENLWSTSVVGGGASSATIFTATITHGPLSPVGGFPTPAAAAAAFESACSTMVLATTFTPVPPVTAITVPPTPVTASPGSLSSPLQTIFESPETGTSAATQASLIGGHIATYLAGWQVIVVTPGPTMTPTPII